MRGPARLGLALVVALLLAAGGYAAYWFVVAGKIKDGVGAWAQSAQADKIEVSWQQLRVGGFPFAFRVELDRATLRDNAVVPPPELRIPSLSGTARPWNFADWRLAAPAGFTGELAGAGERAPAKLTAATANGVVSIEPEGGWNLQLVLQDASIEAGAQIRVSSADARIAVPPEHAEPRTALAVDARQIRLPLAVGPLGDTIHDLDFAVTVKGKIPSGRLADAFAAWRDAGGAIELDDLQLKWGGLGASAAGRIALDGELQPIGAFSGAIQGYGEILTALVESGQMRATDAGLARIALSLLAKPGPDGKPQIKTSFTIRGGQMFLGPAKLGKAPRLTWE